MIPDFHELGGGELLELPGVGVPELPHEVAGVQLSHRTTPGLFDRRGLHHLGLQELVHRGLKEARNSINELDRTWARALDESINSIGLER